jgi:predicted NodU family carbamoyl transferase
VNILSYNPGHDGAVAQLRDGHLIFSVEAEKDSNYRYTPIGSRDMLDAFARLEQVPDIVCTGGWWPREGRPTGWPSHVGYRGVAKDGITVDRRRLIGKSVPFFSSSHERSHLLCGFGMSPFPQGSSCYALVWEGAIGAFYEIDPDLNITLIADVMNEPGNRYASIYGLADPTFPKNAPFARFSDAGKLMALASFAQRSTPTAEEEELMAFLLSSEHVRLDLYDRLEASAYYNVGVDDTEFRNFAGIFSDRIFETFHHFAKTNLRRDLPLVISGGCGLNCDWNTKWRETGIFSDVFVPPARGAANAAVPTTTRSAPASSNRSASRGVRTPPDAWMRAGEATFFEEAAHLLERDGAAPDDEAAPALEVETGHVVALLGHRLEADAGQPRTLPIEPNGKLEALGSDREQQ